MGFTEADIRRVVWTFLQAGIAYVLVMVANWAEGGALNWKALVVGAVAAGFSALKNYLLPDDSRLK